MSAQAQISSRNGSDSSPSTAPVALRVVDEALHVEAERSYLAVSVAPCDTCAASALWQNLSPYLHIGHEVQPRSYRACAISAVCHVGHSGESPPRCQGWLEACAQTDLICYA